ncbi:hypothetical protein SUDANB95_04164 [Actinosynnema sp. ALI-1.44]
MRLMTWNLWWRFGPWRERHQAITRTLRDVVPDVLALQETWTEDGRSQHRLLAEELGLASVGTASDQAPGSPGLGNAVLSRWPIVGSRVVDLSDSPAEPRTALIADIETPWGAVQVVSTHLSWRPAAGSVRRRQTRLIKSRLDRQEPGALPPIVMGDLNCEPTSDELRQLVGLTAADSEGGPVFMDCWQQARPNLLGHTWDRKNPYAAATPWPDRRVDYVLAGLPEPDLVEQGKAAWYEVGGCELAGTSPIDGVLPSDHYAVVASLQPHPSPRQRSL